MHFPVVLDIKPSRRLRAALAFVHALAALALWTAAPDRRLALVGCALLCLSLAYCWRRLRPWRLRLAADGRAYCEFDNGEETPMRIMPGAVVYPWLVVARLQGGQEGRARALVVLADSLNPDDFRALRLWLRWLADFRISAERA